MCTVPGQGQRNIYGRADWSAPDFRQGLSLKTVYTRVKQCMGASRQQIQAKSTFLSILRKKFSLWSSQKSIKNDFKTKIVDL